MVYQSALSVAKHVLFTAMRPRYEARTSSMDRPAVRPRTSNQGQPTSQSAAIARIPLENHGWKHAAYGLHCS